MAKRMFIMLAGMAALVAVLGTVKFRQIQTAAAQAASFQPPPEAVTTIVARQEEWPASLSAIGTVAAVHGVTVSADLPGLVETIAFDSGRTVHEGEVLLRLDTRQEQAQLTAAEAQSGLTRLNLDRARGLREEGIISQADYDRAAAEYEQAKAKAGEIRATIARKTIRAPFSGMLGIRQVNLGQFLNGGTPIVPLQALQPIYVNFAVPQQEVGRLRLDGEVRVTAEGMGSGGFAGRITAIDSVVDEATRNVQVQATLANPDGKLRPGMFVEAHLVTAVRPNAVVVPEEAIVPVQGATFIYAVVDGKAKRRQVDLGVRTPGFVEVTRGVSAGDQVVVGGLEMLADGVPVMARVVQRGPGGASLGTDRP